MGLIHKSVYAYNEPALFWPFCLLCALILITAFSGFYSFATNHNFIISGFIFLVGLIVLVSGLYLWLKIDDNDVYLVLKLVEIHPDNGILFIVIGGVVLAIGGLLGLR